MTGLLAGRHAPSSTLFQIIDRLHARQSVGEQHAKEDDT